MVIDESVNYNFHFFENITYFGSISLSIHKNSVLDTPVCFVKFTHTILFYKIKLHARAKQIKDLEVVMMNEGFNTLNFSTAIKSLL